MAGWTSSYQDNFNVTNYNQYIDSGSVIKNSNLAFDLSSLDYNAAGAAGWGNRLLGLTQTFNPIAWVQTWMGVSDANARKRASEGKEGNFLSDAWDNIVGFGGATIGSFFEGTQIVEKAATGLLLSAGSGLDELNDFIAGKNDKDTWFDKVGKSWDLAATKDIGAGKALLYGLGQQFKFVTGNGFDKKALLDSGNGWLDHDFDIFNAEDKKLLNEGFVMGNVGAVLNFAGEILLDVTSLIPGGTFARIGKKFVGGIDLGTEAGLQAINRARTGAGEKGLIEQHLRLANEDSEEVIANWLKSRNIDDDMLAVAVTLYTKAKTLDEALDVTTLLNYSGTTAALVAKSKLLANVVGKENAHYAMFALDSLEKGGGKLANIARDTRFIDRLEVPTTELGEEFALNVKKLFDDATVSPIIKEDASRIVDAGVRAGRNEAGVLVDTTVKSNIMEFGINTTEIGWKYNKWKSKVTSDNGFFKRIEYTHTYPFIPKLVRVIRSGSRVNTEGIINWNNPALVVEQIKSRLADLDSITKGAFVKSGKSKEFLSKAYAANTDTALKDLWKSLDEEFETAIVSKYNLYDVSKVSELKGKLASAYKAAHDNIETKIDSDIPDIIDNGATIEKVENSGEVVSIAQNADQELAISWTKLDKYLSIDVNKKDFAAALEGVKSYSKPAVQAFNDIWKNIILLRPARFGRERLYSVAGVLFSGNFYDVFLSKNARAAYINFFHNLPTRAERLIDRYKLSRNISKDLEEAKQAFGRVDRNRNAIIAMMNETTNSIDWGFKAHARARTPNELIDAQAIELEKNSTLGYHASTDTVSELRDGEFISLSENPATAAGYVPDKITPLENLKAPRNTNKNKAELVQKNLEEKQLARKQAEEDYKTTKDAEAQKLKDIEENNSDALWNESLSRVRKEELINTSKLSSSKLNKIIISIESKSTNTVKYLKDGTKVITPSPVDKPILDAAYKEIDRRENAIKALDDISKKDISKLDEEILNLENQVKEINSAKEADFNHPQKAPVLDAINNGETIYYRISNTSKWRSITEEQFNKLTPEQLSNREFGFGPANANSLEITNTKIGGKIVDIDEVPDEVWKGRFESKEEFDDWIKNGGAKANNCGRSGDIITSMTRLGLGAITFVDSFGKKSILGNPDFIATASKNPFRDRASEMVTENRSSFQDAIDNPQNYDFDLKNKKELNSKHLTGKEYLDKLNAAQLNGEQLSNYVTESTKEIERLTALSHQLSSRIKSLEEAALPTNTGFKTRSTGKVEYRGQIYDNFAEGRAGQYAAAIASPADTWNRIHNMERTSSAVAGARGKATGKFMEPSDPRYYDTWASWLEVYGRGDEVIAQLANGRTIDEVVSWLSTTKAGKEYAQRMKIGSKYTKASEIAKLNNEAEAGYHEPFESFVSDRASIVNEQMFVPEVKELFNSETPITGAALRKIFAGKENQLVPIMGRLTNPASSRRVMVATGDFFRKVNKILVEHPQEVLDNFPLATELYQKEMKNLIDLNLTGGKTKLTVEEMNAMQDIARRKSIKEMQKWLYNVQSRTNFEAAISHIVPFVTAYTFTVKMFMRLLREKPERALWIASGMNNTVGELNWIDQNGEPTNMLQANALVIPLDKNIKGILEKLPFWQGLKDEKEITLSARSLNIFFGGEVIPAPGPLVSVPVSEWVKANPVFAAAVNKATKDIIPFIPGGTGLVDYLLPMGPSDKPLSYDQLLPGYANLGLDVNAIGRWFGSDYRGQQYIDAMGKVAAYESAKARLLGPDEPLPTEAEIMEKVDAMYHLKMISAFWSPVSFQVKTEADLAKREYQKYKKIWGDSADWKFLTERPELVGAVASSIKNPYQLNTDIQTAANLDANPEVVDIFMNAGDAGKDMLGFFMNASNNPEFDNYAYTYLKEKGAGVGEENYYSKLSTSERSRRAAAQAGWISFNKLMSTIDAELIDTNTTIDNNTKLKAYKAAGIANLREKFPEWAADYSSQDAYKFAERADTLSELFTNNSFVSKFGNKPEVTAIAVFLSQREKVRQVLQQRKSLGYSGSIESTSNQDVALTYNQIIAQLKTESIRFADFYNRFFDGDSLVF
jgi:hypothetical protein